MPDAEAVAIAKAVVTALNGATLSETFTAVRSYAPYTDIKDLTDLTVKVFSGDWVPTPIARKMTDNEFLVDIGIQQKLTAGLNTDAEICAFCDPLVYLVQQIVDLFQMEPLQGYSTAACMVTQPAPVYDPEEIRTQRVFTSVIRITFRETRTLA